MIPFARPDITEREVEAVADCLRSGWLTAGRLCTAFEEEFAERVGAKHALAVSSGTGGFLLVLDALGVGPGMEVIVPACTFSSPAMMAHRLGARIVLVDVDPVTRNMDPVDLTAAITPNTGLIIPTHFAGLPANMEAITRIAEQYGVPVVDDAAHAFPVAYQGRMIGGGHARATVFSFYATKTITTGEGGMVTTNDDDLAARMRKLRSHGFDTNMLDRHTNPERGWYYEVALPGWKLNMNDPAAALGRVQLDRAEDMRDRRARIAAMYRSRLEGLLEMPADADEHAWHLFVVEHEDRDRFIAGMRESGVQCSVHFIPLNLQPFWRKLGARECPQAVTAYKKSVSLPLYSAMSPGDVAQVVKAVSANCQTKERG